jgi:IS1 family transposase
MNILPRDKQIEIIAALCEGVSIRATERLTGVHRDTIMRLGARVGQGCAALHDRTMRNLTISRIELDELWAFIGKKQRKVRPEDGPHAGDCYTFLALDGLSKGILAYQTGKRDGVTTHHFIRDLRERVINRPEISADAFIQYPRAIEAYFGAEVDFGQIEKHYSTVAAKEAARRYSPGYVVSVETRQVVGMPRQISTSYVERANLTVRMQQRRFTRLTNAFSKKLENHQAAVSLYVGWYNLCRVHEALRVTPAVQLGVANHVWSIGELIDAAFNDETPAPQGKRVGRFNVIDGNLK